MNVVTDIQKFSLSIQCYQIILVTECRNDIHFYFLTYIDGTVNI